MRSSCRRWALFLTTLALVSASSQGWAWGVPPAAPPPVSGAEETTPPSPPSPPGTVTIPGPLNSFLRMAAVSRVLPPEDVLPLLSHQIVLDGYGGRSSSPTEYLKLVKEYVGQARELQALAGPDGVIRVNNCDNVEQLLNVIGYRHRGACGRTLRWKPRIPSVRSLPLILDFLSPAWRRPWRAASRSPTGLEALRSQ